MKWESPFRDLLVRNIHFYLCCIKTEETGDMSQLFSLVARTVLQGPSFYEVIMKLEYTHAL